MDQVNKGKDSFGENHVITEPCSPGDSSALKCTRTRRTDESISSAVKPPPLLLVQPQPRSDGYQRRNKDLSEEERLAKRSLKRLLKTKKKQKRLETRLLHALRRNDDKTAQETRRELQQFQQEMEKEEQRKVAAGSLEETSTSNTDIIFNSILHNGGTPGDTSIPNGLPVANAAVEETPERCFVIKISQELQQRQPSNSQSKQATKEQQTDQAVQLLRHMSKATQQRTMFQNTAALWGYARQKFYERSMLVCRSLLKLDPTIAVGTTHTALTPAQGQLRRNLWEGLGAVQQICSIGCGPGNDAVGMVAFLHSLRVNMNQSGSGSYLKRAILLDWAMEDWSVVLDPLQDLLVPNNIQCIQRASCDVTQPLYSNDNRQALALLVEETETPTLDATTPILDVDLVLVSYLLTEVRGQWESFLDEIVKKCRPGTLFYFAEPSPWQLHRLVRLLDSLDFCWLDSSMNDVQLQPLENRLGPAVLIGRKR